jgi:hypothetical protein
MPCQAHAGRAPHRSIRIGQTFRQRRQRLGSALVSKLHDGPKRCAGSNWSNNGNAAAGAGAGGNLACAAAVQPTHNISSQRPCRMGRRLRANSPPAFGHPSAEPERIRSRFYRVPNREPRCAL